MSKTLRSPLKFVGFCALLLRRMARRPSAAQSCTWTHPVRYGDTLSQIAPELRNDNPQLIALNPADYERECDCRRRDLRQQHGSRHQPTAQATPSPSGTRWKCWRNVTVLRCVTSCEPTALPEPDRRRRGRLPYRHHLLPRQPLNAVNPTGELASSPVALSAFSLKYSVPPLPAPHELSRGWRFPALRHLRRPPPRPSAKRPSV